MTPSNLSRLRTDLAELIAMWIASEGLLQREAGERLGMPQQVVSRIVRGKGSLVALERLVQGFERVGGRVHLKVDWPFPRRIR